jgi:hypothetical protein
MKKLETGNIGIGNTSILATIGRLLAAVVLLASGGCQSMKENGILSPRSGELFQTTRMGPGKTTESCCMVTVWGLFAASEGHSFGYLVALAGLPLALPAYIVDECVVSPLTDIVCLPYDLCQPNHGFYIRIVDEDGKPVPNVRVSGGVDTGMDNLLELDESSFDGKTDKAGEFLVSRLFGKPTGSFRASALGYMPWYFPKNIKLDGVKPEADGRIVLQYVVKKSDLGTWKAKTDMTREEILSILPGKWSADSETRKLLATELSWPSTDDPDKHCFTIDPAGSVVSRVPEDYRSAFCRDNPWRNGDKFVIWKLHRKGELELKWNAKEQEDWLWAVRLIWTIPLTKSKGEYSIQDEYYLGEDEKGIYLSPGFHSDFIGPEITLKFRKVTE